MDATSYLQIILRPHSSKPYLCARGHGEVLEEESTGIDLVSPVQTGDLCVLVPIGRCCWLPFTQVEGVVVESFLHSFVF
jgi:hypothetical protein